MVNRLFLYLSLGIAAGIGLMFYGAYQIHQRATDTWTFTWHQGVPPDGR